MMIETRNTDDSATQQKQRARDEFLLSPLRTQFPELFRPELTRNQLEHLGLELFRKEEISKAELRAILGMTRWDIDPFLVEHNEFAQTLTHEELDEDLRTLRALAQRRVFKS